MNNDNELLNVVLDSMTTKISSTDLTLLYAILRKPWLNKADKLVVSTILFPVVNDTYMALRGRYDEKFQNLDLRSALQMEKELFAMAREFVLEAAKANI